MKPTRTRPSDPELLAPAGRLSSGVYALENGADALYLGLSAFSARKAAKNFTLDEFARIKGLAEQRGKKVYAALNTVIRDDELTAAAELLYDLEALEVDGVIIQDLGLLDLLNRNFPRIPVHASTQMGIHNSAGVEFLMSHGVRRIILSRELTLEEIAEVRARNPEVELEVFIHGALCRSFSGLCLASGILLGRSANRGECAQICRTWFEVTSGNGTTGGPPRRGYFFSADDLAAGELVLRLRDIGIDSFKIEGRMKPPEWVAAVTAYYRAVLDGRTPAETRRIRDEGRIIFSRLSGPGWLAGDGGSVNALFPGHTGIPAGRVLPEKGSGEPSGDAARPGRPGGFRLRLETDLAVRDGLLYFRPGGRPGDPPSPVQFAVAAMEEGGRRVTSARAGREVRVSGPHVPPPGTEVRKVSSHAAKLPEISGNIPPKRVAADLTLRLLPDGIEAVTESPHGLFGPLRTILSSVPEPARSPRPFADIAARHLTPPGDSRFGPGGIRIENLSGLPDDGIFVNPGILKEFRRTVYARLEEEYLRKRKLKAVSTREDITPGAGPHAFPVPADSPPPASGPARSLLPPGKDGIPFVTDPSRLGIADLHREPDGRVYLPLFPVLFDADSYLAGIEDFIRRILAAAPGLKIVLGLGNTGHLRLAETFAFEERVEFFADYGLYAANRRTVLFLKEAVPRLLFYYPWIEEATGFPAALPAGQYGAFLPPLFISRACAWRNGVFGKGEVCANCGSGRSLVLRQGKNSFLLRTTRAAGACLNLLFPA